MDENRKKLRQNISYPKFCPNVLTNHLLISSNCLHSFLLFHKHWAYFLHSSQKLSFLISHVCWAPKNWCFWTVVLEKILESPLDCKEIQPVHPKGEQSWVFTGRTYVEAETPILWTPHSKSWLIGKDPDAGRDWGQEEKGMTEDEMAGWHHRLDGHGFE